MALTFSRQRFRYLPALLLAFFAGLVTHCYARHLPHWVAQYVPDTLWALWVYLALVFIASRLVTWQALCYALAFSYCMEVTQLYHTAWIDSVRATTIGALILGSTFQWGDLLCYTVGILSGALIDVSLQQPQLETASIQWDNFESTEPNAMV
ncbi:MAG: DUF2809 domain-containing protein [Abitibacteriaceae bacterium]|nr:DUF2809 domain-containing protein [Abditibacteriaceae bacterium]